MLSRKIGYTQKDIGHRGGNRSLLTQRIGAQARTCQGNAFSREGAPIKRIRYKANIFLVMFCRLRRRWIFFTNHERAWKGSTDYPQNHIVRQSVQADRNVVSISATVMSRGGVLVVFV